MESLSVTQVWDGPSVDGKKGWGRTSSCPNLITVLASRRIPEADAEGRTEEIRRIRARGRARRETHASVCRACSTR